MIKSMILYHLELRYCELVDEIYAINILDDLCRLIVEYSHYRINDYSDIFNLKMRKQDRA